MMRLPLFPTIVVAAAVAAMIGLGIWQLQRAEWKEGLLARYEAAASQPAIPWRNVSREDESHFFRRAYGRCEGPVQWRSGAGRSAGGEAGWSHIARCANGMAVDIGWSRQATSPAWSGGAVEGILAPDSRTGVRLIAERPAPGLQLSAPPSPESIPNNHLLYAVQWFFFAAAAVVIYVLAAKRRGSPGS